jgi:glycosyltransferase involved in cell wall biosynthesis
VFFRCVWDDQRTLSRLTTAVKPDLIYAFSFYGLSMALLLAAQRLGYPVAYAFSAEWLERGFRGDPWLSFWDGEAGTAWKRSLKRLARRLVDLAVPTGLVPIDVRHAYFTSRRLRELYVAKGFPVQDAEVIHWGVDLARFRPPEPPGADRVVRLLFAGRIAEEKGLHTVIDALALLRDEGNAGRARLTVAGPAQEADYLASVSRRIAECGLQADVRLLGPVSPEAMPALYREHDVFLLPSIWEEPFSIGLLEAMASGLAVVGTTTGGSGEVLTHEANGLTFPPGDARELARQLRRAFDPEARRRIGCEARKRVERGFSTGRMMERVEEFLRKASRAGVERGMSAEHARR